MAGIAHHYRHCDKCKFVEFEVCKHIEGAAGHHLW